MKKAKTPTKKVFCARCTERVIGEFFLIGEVYYHKACLRCDQCWKILEKGYFEYDGQLYCEECFRKLGFASRPKCQTCKNPILQGKYLRLGDMAWHNDCCRCKTCQRILQGTTDSVIENNTLFCRDCKRKRKSVGVQNCITNT